MMGILHGKVGWLRMSQVELGRGELLDVVGRAPRAERLKGVNPRPLLLDLRVVMVTLTGFCVFMNVYATQTLLPLLERVFGATKFHVSMTVSATTVGIALAAPLVGLLAERVGRRQTMAASVALLTLPILLAATAPGLNCYLCTTGSGSSLSLWRAATETCTAGATTPTAATG